MYAMCGWVKYAMGANKTTKPQPIWLVGAWKKKNRETH